MHGIDFARSATPRALRARLRAARRVFFGLLRVAALLTLLLGIATVFWLRDAEARLSEALSGFGAELARWAPARLHSAPRELNVNGLRLGHVTATTAESVSAALDRFEARCRARGGIDASAVLGKAVPSLLSGVLRRDSKREGLLACIETGRPLTLAELSVRLRAVGSTGDLRELGELRYVLARRDGTNTTLVILWTDGAFPVLRAFPKDRDAPGRDPLDIPRPERTRRLLSASEGSAPYAITAYAATAYQPAQLLDWYDEALRAQGFTTSATASGGIHARRGARALVVSTSMQPNGAALVTVAELSR